MRRVNVWLIMRILILNYYLLRYWHAQHDIIFIPLQPPFEVPEQQIHLEDFDHYFCDDNNGRGP
jgi:hypothetical protein